jgi:uncharacterized protein YcnI
MHSKYLTIRGLAAAATLLAAVVPASAHITFENKEVKAGTTVKFVLRVPHGCTGAATTGVRVEIPEGLANVKPQPKPGWELSVATTSEEHTGSAGAHDSHGAAVKEVAWTGGNLPDAHYDEFVFRAAVSREQSEVVYIPIVQECEVGVERWIEVPGDGGSSDNLKYPAPSVRVQP